MIVSPPTISIKRDDGSELTLSLDEAAELVQKLAAVLPMRSMPLTGPAVPPLPPDAP